mgnify:CR=1 FL=1
MQNTSFPHLFFQPQKTVHTNSPDAFLFEEAVRAGSGQISARGALAVDTRPHTGRSPDDKFIVRTSGTEDLVWWGPVNRPMHPRAFSALAGRLGAHLAEKTLYAEEVWLGQDPAFRQGLRVVTESPWHALFAKHMFVPLRREAAAPSQASRFQDIIAKDDERPFHPQWTLLHAPSFFANPAEEETRSEVFVAMNLEERLILIGGTAYAGEIKKAMFTVMNWLMPQEGVLPMHCAANISQNGDVALFFGLSGTGKTTLSTDPGRPLIGDDEHGWTPHGVFNFEGGCYAKVIRLSSADEPLIHAAATCFPSIVENIVLNPRTREPDFYSDAITENTRASYPLAHLGQGASAQSWGPHPKTVFFLTADAFGVLPPVARLSADEAMFYFINGYTARVAGTERGVKEPQAVFSACFGAPFLPLPPLRYAEMLGEKLRAWQPEVWMVNTGWIRGPYGVGERIAIAASRAIIQAATSGELALAPTVQDPIFGFAVPTKVQGVPEDILIPRRAWADEEAYDKAARHLARLYQENLHKVAPGEEARALFAAGPKVG